MVPLDVFFGDEESRPNVRLEIIGFKHPEVAEPDGLDLLTCRVHATAPPVSGIFDVSVRVDELLAVREYFRRINSGNGPPVAFAIAGDLLSLSFAPSRRGPVLCAVQLKSIDASHVRLEYLVTLEPASITRSIDDLCVLERAAAE
ncbi:MAG: hypothetical protein M3R51_05245 [Candidatus Eremiobacteraeota bacterium]|nr:hypothetical protein [Candidatus Eremiobacteraeota bacterium]